MTHRFWLIEGRKYVEGPGFSDAREKSEDFSTPLVYSQKLSSTVPDIPSTTEVLLSMNGWKTRGAKYRTAIIAPQFLPPPAGE